MKKLYRKRTVHPSPPTISDLLSFLPATILALTVALSPEDTEVLAYLISCFSSSNGGNPRRTTKGGGAVNVGGEHPPLFHCSCFRCYMSYWVRWDSSPNHQLIHEIIDAFEDSLAAQTSNKKVKRNKRGSNNNNNNNNKSPELKRSEFALSSPRNSSVPAELESVGESSSSSNNSSGGVGEGGDGVEDEEKGSNNNNNKSPELKRSEFALSSPPNSSVSAELESVGESSSSSNDSSGGVGEGGDGVKDEEKGSVRRFVSFIGERIWGAWGQ